MPVLSTEATRREEQGIEYAKQVYVRNSKVRIPEVIQVDTLLAKTGSSADAALKAYQSAKKLDETLTKFAATMERAEKVLLATKTELATAAKYPNDRDVLTAARSTTQAMNELSAKTQSIYPQDGPQISQLTDGLLAEQGRVKAFTRQTTGLRTGAGKQLYEGCTSLAKRNGLASSVRVFKDDATNDAARQGEKLCRCMAGEIAADTQITDEAKLEIARQFETTDHMKDQQLALVVGAVSTRCVVQMTDELTGGKLSGRH